MKVFVQTTRKFRYDVYYDYENHKYRFDSYGVPMAILLKESPMISNIFAGREELKTSLLKAEDEARSSKISNKHTTQGLYSFIFDYQQLLMFSMFPGSCVISPLQPLEEFPSIGTQYEDLLGEATYSGQRELNGEMVDHYIRNYVFTQIDYFQTAPRNGTLPQPRQLVVADVSYTFSDINPKKPDPSVFLPPADCRVV